MVPTAVGADLDDTHLEFAELLLHLDQIQSRLNASRELSQLVTENVIENGQPVRGADRAVASGQRTVVQCRPDQQRISITGVVTEQQGLGPSHRLKCGAALQGMAHPLALRAVELGNHASRLGGCGNSGVCRAREPHWLFRPDASTIGARFRGISSVGRATALQAVGQGFEPPMLHPKCLTGTAQSVARARPDAVLPCSCDGERGETDLERAPDPAQSEAQRCRPVSERVRTASSGNTMNARICTSHWPPKTRCSQPRQPGILLASHSAPSVIATITATSMTARTRSRDEPGAGRPAAALRPEVIMLAGARPRGASAIARHPKRCQLLGQRFRHLHGQRVSGVRPDLGCHVRDEFCLRQ